MTVWEGIFSNIDGAWPNLTAKNATSPTTPNGTEFIATLVNDGVFGWIQALMDHVGLSRNGVSEQVGNSQILECLLSFGIPGEYKPNFWNDDPVALGIRAIPLIGQGVLKASYPLLDANVYVGDANNPTAAAFYHADDAAGLTRNTTGAYLILPDSRGQFLRIEDPTGSVDPDGATRELGDLQEDSVQKLGIYVAGSAGALSGISNNANAVGGSTSTTAPVGYYDTLAGNSTSIFGDPTGTNPLREDVETRSTNIQAKGALCY